MRTLTTLGLVVLWIALVAAAVVAEATWFAEPDVRRGDIASLERYFVDELREAAADRRLGSAALVLIERGKIVAEHSFGTPVNLNETRFRVASIGKAVTAWGAMALVQQGRVGLDEPVRPRTRARLRGSDADLDGVTLRTLLSHTAAVDDTLAVTRKPGTAMAYSGGGYTVTELLIEEATRQSFGAFMNESVLHPLGMTGATFDCDGQGLAPNYDAGLKVQPFRPPATRASAGLCATPRDLARFVAAFTRENPVLRRDTLQQMAVAQPGTSGTWGLGLALYGGGVVGHDGGASPAWGAAFRVNPATGNGMIVMSTGGRGAINRMGGEWVSWETGTLPFATRRQVVYDRLLPASIAIVVGAIAIAIVQWRRKV